MKGISAFVATILLVGFTVAVGAIISAWFLTYTRTTTGGVSAATACAAGMLDVIVPSISGNQILVQVLNRGTLSLSNVSVSISCGASSFVYTIPSLAAGSVNTTSISISCATDYSNIAISTIATCTGGGTTAGGCTGIGCKP